MAFDGITVAALVREFRANLLEGRISRIAQTEKDELILQIKRAREVGGGQTRLYLSADASLPLAYLTDESKAAPMQAPGFCMLLRKHLGAGRIVDISQPGLERIIRFTIESYNEMGDLTHSVLVIEIMGKHSNIILLDDREKVIDSIKRIPGSLSSVREVLPGRDYFIPRTLDKIDPLEAGEEELAGAVAGGNGPAYKRIYGQGWTGMPRRMWQEPLP